MSKWVAIILLLLSIWIYFEWPDEKLHLVFCDVGQGDGALVIKGRFQALIDTGPSVEKMDRCISNHTPFWDRKIEIVFLSHHQKDHDGAYDELVRRYKVEKTVREVLAGDTYRVGNIYFDILSGMEPGMDSNGLSSQEVNELAQVILVRFGEFEALFTGDIGEPTELALLASGVLRKVEVLKVPHHGSKYSSSQKFLEAVSPSVAVISVGAKNSYGHPTGDTLMRLEAVGAKVLRTDQLGTVEINVEGDKIGVLFDK